MENIKYIDTTLPGVSDEDINKSIIIKRGAGIPLNQVELDYLRKNTEEDREENEKNFTRHNNFG